MGQPRILVDTFINPRIYGLHVLSASENSDNAPLVGAARRSTYDGWTSVTANLDAWLKSRNGTPRPADMIVLDRGHNLAGKTVKAQCSDDDFVSPAQDAFSGALPTYSSTGALTDDFGVLTPEGAWLKRYNERLAYDWRAFVPAMGAGLKPLVTGLWIGMSWGPGYADRPFAPGITELVVEEQESDLGWRGRGKGTRRRTGVMHLSFTTPFDAETAAPHLEQLARGRAFWIIPDDARAETSFLAVIPRGMFGLVLEPRYFYEKLDIPYSELDPSDA
jgi:hypothetical protein